MVFSMEKAPIRSSTLRPYSVTEPKAVVFEAMASRINAKTRHCDLLFAKQAPLIPKLRG